MDESVLVWYGRQCLSQVRQERLKTKLSGVAPAVQAITGRCVYFLTLENTLDAKQRQVLMALLDVPPSHGQPFNGYQDDFDFDCLKMPASDTVSRWSATAKEILERSGLDTVVRIERGVLYRVQSLRVLIPSEREAVRAMLPEPEGRAPSGPMPAQDGAVWGAGLYSQTARVKTPEEVGRFVAAGMSRVTEAGICPTGTFAGYCTVSGEAGTDFGATAGFNAPFMSAGPVAAAGVNIANGCPTLAGYWRVASITADKTGGTATPLMVTGIWGTEKVKNPAQSSGALPAELTVKSKDSSEGSRVARRSLPKALLLKRSWEQYESSDNEKHAPVLSTNTDLTGMVLSVLEHPSVASKQFLITIADQTGGALTARDSMAGPWQVPVADCAVTLSDFQTNAGQAIGIGERLFSGTGDPAPAARMAVAEALLNLSAADIDPKTVKAVCTCCHVNGTAETTSSLKRAVDAATIMCSGLGIPLAVEPKYSDTPDAVSAADREPVDGGPLSLTVVATAPVGDAGKTLTPYIGEGDYMLVFLDLSGGQARLGGSIFEQVADSPSDLCGPDVDPAVLSRALVLIRSLADSGLIAAYHDRSDGGLLTAAAEMMFASRRGIQLDLTGYTDSMTLSRALFNEEPGVLMAVAVRKLPAVVERVKAHKMTCCCHFIGLVTDRDRLEVSAGSAPCLELDRVTMQTAWQKVSRTMAASRDCPQCVIQEAERVADRADTGLFVRTLFDINDSPAAPYITTGACPPVAVLSECTVTGYTELAQAFERVGFAVSHVTMTDLLSGQKDLADYIGIACAGGFSPGDVWGAGAGWAAPVLFNERLGDAFGAFFERGDTFGLGIGNGAQMFSRLAAFIPGAQHWPYFVRNQSEQFEARLVNVEILPCPSLFLTEMAGSVLPVPVSHGFGRVTYAAPEDVGKVMVAARYVDYAGLPTERYPFNPDGSAGGETAFTSNDGRFTIMMPHPERACRAVRLSWYRPGQGDKTGWMRMFENIRKAVG